MLKAIIIEDEPIAVEILEHYISQSNDVQVLEVFHTSMEAMEYLKSASVDLAFVDLAFVDINLPDISGIDFVKSLASPPSIIFTTAYSEHAVEGFELNAVDYLMKPFSYNRFLQAVSKTKEKISFNHILHLKSGKKTFLVKCMDILWIEGNGDYLNVHTQNQKIIINQSLKQILEELPTNFFQIHRSYIINRDYIQYVEKSHINIHGTNIRIGESYRNSIPELLSICK